MQAYERGDILSGLDEAVGSAARFGGGSRFVLLAGPEDEEAAEEAKPCIEDASAGGWGRAVVQLRAGLRRMWVAQCRIVCSVFGGRTRIPLYT